MRLCIDQVVIRDFREEDIVRKVDWINNPENNTFLHYDLPLDVENTRRWYKNKNNNVRTDCIIEYNGIPVGLIGLLAIETVNSKAELYISIGEPMAKRKGIATKAIALMLHYAFDERKLNKIYLNVDADNIAACGLYEKSGFICEGFFRKDMVHHGVLIDRKRYAILRENYMKAKAASNK